MLAREITWTLVIKFAALFLLWYWAVRPVSNQTVSQESLQRVLLDPAQPTLNSQPSPPQDKSK